MQCLPVILLSPLQTISQNIYEDSEMSLRTITRNTYEKHQSKNLREY